jgi:hypothetical protein
MSRRLVAVLAISCSLVFVVAASSAFAVTPKGSVTVQKVGNGYVSGDGVDCGATCTVSVPYSCDTSTKPPLCEPGAASVTAQDANGFAFDHWDGCDFADGRDCSTMAPVEGATVTAYFNDVQAPTVALSQPSPGDILSGTMILRSAASDNAGIAHVDYYVDGAFQGWASNGAPYEFWVDTSGFPDGPATIEADAVDTSGNVSSRVSRSVVFDNHDPLIDITSGPNGETYQAGSSQTWTFSVTDAGSGVQSVACAVDGDNFVDCTGGLTSHTVSGATPGTHGFTVRAIDNAGRVVFASRSWTIASGPANTAKPKISGPLQVGQILTATNGTWSGSPTSFAYRWQRCSASGTACADIGTADANDDADYKLTSADAGKTIRLRVTASNASGDASAASAVTAIVGLPVNTAAPLISGTPKVGTQLKTTTGTWTHGPIIAYKYAWQRCAATGKSCVAIGTADATDDADYTPVAADAGHAIKVVVTARNAYGSAKKGSLPTAAVAV